MYCRYLNHGQRNITADTGSTVDNLDHGQHNITADTGSIEDDLHRGQHI